MQLVHITNLVIPSNRQRKQFPRKELEDLKESILSKGLMHPLVVRNDGKTLVGGERRYRAITELYQEGNSFNCNGVPCAVGAVPVTMLAEMSDLDVMEAELEENTVRLDLTWQERAAATLQLKELRTSQAASRGEEYHMTQLATEIRGASNASHYVARDVTLAENFHHKEVAQAKTVKDAVKALRKIKAREHRAELASMVDTRNIPHDIRQGDMRELIVTLPSEHFDLIITDPPYGKNADDFGSMASTGHNYSDSWEYARELYTITAQEGYRITKPEAHAYVFCTFEHYQKVADIFDLAGWSVWPRPIIWSKGNGMLPRPDHGPRYTYECILFAAKGSRKVVLVKPDVIAIGSDRQLCHGAQKPVDLYADLISRTCLPGNRIFDPFGGSGTTITAGAGANCTVTLFELDRGNFDLCLGRLREESSLDQIDLELEVEEE